ncbi:MAG: ribonuclease III [Gammaproteobacteria bacterium]|nr:ribonuclease III [Gammaproteobacteria bacterium]
MPTALETLQQTIGYEFRDAALAELALTHRSANRKHNERLEFLGDALLGFLVAELSWHAHPKADEGDLTIMRAQVVSRPALALVAREIDLGEAIKLSAGEARGGGRRRESILAAAMEALIAAIYLDGGFDACRAFVQRWIPDPGRDFADGALRKDNKTRLQELTQAERRSLPAYELVEVSGKGHEQLFTMRCKLPGHRIATEGSGPSRRAAEQMAAGKALAALGQDE